MNSPPCPNSSRLRSRHRPRNHVQLSTQQDLQRRSTAFGAEPNTQASPVDLALPGTLPVLNRAAVERAIRFGLAVGAKVAPLSSRARTTSTPTCPRATRSASSRSRWCRAARWSSSSATEEQGQPDPRPPGGRRRQEPARGLHGQSGIDLNRAGTPLLEIVSEPDMRSAAEAVAYAKTLHALVMWLGICDGNMQEGSFRCDANVSVRKPGQPFGTRREIKNLNSFRFLRRRSTTR
jgi:aspartyl-tRNA(Asn)/glutamyl-tRNA(Gln) amidotransferase subunit B